MKFMLLPFFLFTTFAASQGLDLRLHIAAADGDKAKIDNLLSEGLSANKLDENKYPAVYFAFDASDEEVALLLLSRMDLNLKAGEQKENLLFLAIRKNQLRSVEYLLSKNPQLLKEKSLNGMTALMIAARTSTPEIVQILLKKGANPLEKNSFGKTALEMAQKSQNRAVIILLQEAQKKK